MYSNGEELKKTKFKLIKERIGKIEYAYVNGYYGDFVSRMEYEAEYRHILELLDVIPDLTDEERTEIRSLIKENFKGKLEYEKKEKLEYGHSMGFDNFRYNSLLKTKAEFIVDIIKQIEYANKVDAGYPWGKLNAYEATGEYRDILKVLDEIPDLTDEEKAEIKSLIEEKFQKIFEEEDSLEIAFKKAEDRFSGLSEYQKAKAKEMGIDPNRIKENKNININEIIEVIDRYEII